MPSFTLQLSDVVYKIKHQTIIDHVSGTFSSGKITSLIGPSGAGKSTLFRLLNQLKTQTSGVIKINDKDVTTYDMTTLRRQVGIVLQDGIMLEGSVFENLSLPIRLRGASLLKEDAVVLLEKVGLKESLLHQEARTLSGGQKQKLSIARTLVNKPDILLLDEITSSLDPVSTKAIESLIVTLNKTDNLTILWITHNIDQAKRLSDDTWVMIDGKPYYQGKTSTLHQTEDARVLKFLTGGIN